MFMSVFQGCCRKLPQSGWLKPIGSYSLTVLEARRWKSKSRQGWFLLGTQRRICPMPLSQVLVVDGNPWRSLTCDSLIPVSASDFIGPSSICVYVQISLFLKGHQSYQIQASPQFQYNLVVTCVHLQRPYFQVRSPTQVPGGHECWEDIIQSRTVPKL